MPKPARREAAVPSVSAVEGPRRAALLQDRSRRTRRRLVRAALGLWAERGFDRGVEETTVEEIARAAGVTKGTFYFHFAHKEDILLELGWGTAEAMYDEAVAGAAEGRPADEVLDGLLRSLTRRVAAVPKVAVARAVAEFYRRDRAGGEPHHFGIRRSFTVAMELARRQAAVPADADPGELAIMLEVVAMEALLGWADTPSAEPLLDVLRRRAAIIVHGARWTEGVTPWPPSGRLRTAPVLREGGA